MLFEVSAGGQHLNEEYDVGKGILFGLIWGGVTGTAVVSVLSLYAPLPNETRFVPAAEETRTEPDAEEPSADVPADDVKAEAAETDEVAEPVVTETPEPKAEATEELEVEASEQSEANDKQADTEVGPTVVEETSTQEPEVGVEETTVVVEPTPEEPAPTVLTEAPERVDNQSLALSENTQLPSSDAALQNGEVVQLEQDALEAPFADLETPSTPANPLIATAAPTTPEESEAPLAPDAPQITISENIAPEGLAAPQPDRLPTASGDVVARATPAETEPPTITTVSADTPIILPVPNIQNPVEGVVTNRLPSVGGAESNASEEVVTEEESTPAPDASEVGALNAYAASVDGVATGSLFSVILIDDGASGVARSELIALDVPFSVAIDPSVPNAAAIAAEYRGAGIEVLAILNDLPPSAEPSDVAVAVEGYFGVLKEAIAVMDPLDGRIQSNRSLLQPILGAIRETGHGLVTYDRGLNTAQQAARREGIAAATIFRVLDADEEQAPKIKRYLNRAAFNASKDGTVVVMGRSRPETVKALLEWALDEKDGALSIVPVSQVMQKDLG